MFGSVTMLSSVMVAMPAAASWRYFRDPASFPGDTPPAAGVWLGMVLVLAGLTLAGVLLGGLTIQSARYMQQRRYWNFSMVIAGLNCLLIPPGPIVGLATFLVLRRVTIQADYIRNQDTAAS